MTGPSGCILHTGQYTAIYKPPQEKLKDQDTDKILSNKDKYWKIAVQIDVPVYFPQTE